MFHYLTDATKAMPILFQKSDLLKLRGNRLSGSFMKKSLNVTKLSLPFFTFSCTYLGSLTNSISVYHNFKFFLIEYVILHK